MLFTRVLTEAQTLLPARLSANSSNLQEGFANGCPNLDCHFFLFIGSVSQFPGVGSSRRSAAVKLDGDEFCSADVEDELVPGLDHNPGTTNNVHKLSVLHIMLFTVWSTVVFDCWPTHGGARVLRRVLQVEKLQACPRSFAPSLGCQRS